MLNHSLVEPDPHVTWNLESQVNFSVEERHQSGYLQRFGVYCRNTLREKCPNTEFSLVRIFPHSDWIRRDTPYLSVFSPDAGKYRPEKTPYISLYSVRKRENTDQKKLRIGTLFTLWYQPEFSIHGTEN